MHRLRQPCRYVKLVRKLTRCSAIGQRRGCCHLLHPWTWNLKLLWDAQIAATVQVCEASPKLARCSAIGQRRGCRHLLHPWTWNLKLLWDAQIAATVQVCEACQEVDEMFSDWTEARLLPSVASLDLEPEVVVGCTDCGNRAGM